MKKQCLIVLAAMATMVIGLGSLASVQGSDIVASVYGNTVVQDPEGDLMLKKCDFSKPDVSCSLPPDAPLGLPGYFDIKKAKITEIGGGLVDLSITLYEPIPAMPPEEFVQYFWQFQGGCIGNTPGSKTSIFVGWRQWPDSETFEWQAHWSVITSCAPRETSLGPAVPFKFTEDGVKVRVALSDLLEGTIDGYTLIWFVGVRRLPFHPELFTNTVPVDFAPDVSSLNPHPPPEYIDPEDPATWEPR